MTIAAIQNEVKTKLDNVRAALAGVITGASDVCLTCSFQAEDVLLTKLAIELDAQICRSSFSIPATTSRDLCVSRSDRAGVAA